MQPARRLVTALLLCLLGLLTGCDVELYSGLREREGNEMLAVLLSEGIRSKKVSGKGQVVSLLVEEAQVARAVEVLRRNGYPKDQFASIGDIFRKESLISSPVEERIRFIYALSTRCNSCLNSCA